MNRAIVVLVVLLGASPAHADGFGVDALFALGAGGDAHRVSPLVETRVPLEPAFGAELRGHGRSGRFTFGARLAVLATRTRDQARHLDARALLFDLGPLVTFDLATIPARRSELSVYALGAFGGAIALPTFEELAYGSAVGYGMHAELGLGTAWRRGRAAFRAEIAWSFHRTMHRDDDVLLRTHALAVRVGVGVGR